MTEKTICAILILNFLLFLINLTFTISGSIILDQNKELSNENEFQNVWISNLILTIISGIGAFISLTTCCGLTQSGNDENEKSNKNHIFEVIGLGVSIWALVIFFDADTNLGKLESDYYSLFMLFQIRVYYCLTLFGILGLILVLCLIYCCFASIFVCCFDENKASDVIYQSSMNTHVSNQSSTNTNGEPISVNQNFNMV